PGAGGAGGEGGVGRGAPGGAGPPACGAVDGGPPPLDAGPPPFDAGPPPLDADVMCAVREEGPAACTDGRDNDCDGIADCADSDCTPFGDECCNGVDDNGNGIADEFACRCTSDAQCASGPLPNVCWRTLFGVCAPPCDLFGGDAACRMIDPSLRCSPAGECTF